MHAQIMPQEYTICLNEIKFSVSRNHRGGDGSWGWVGGSLIVGCGMGMGFCRQWCVMGGDALSLFVDAGLGMRFRRCFWEAFVALAWAGLAGWPGALALWLFGLLLGHER